MVCESCGKNKATHKTTDIVNNVKSVKFLCASCFKRDGRDSPFSKFNLLGFLSAKVAPEISIQIVKPSPDEAERIESRSCPECGMNAALFKKKGAIGCPQDYEVLEEEIAALLMRLHGAREHRGRFPKDFQNRRAREHQASQLENEMQRAIEEERFEEAAALRDRIRALRRAESEPSRTTTDGDHHV